MLDTSSGIQWQEHFVSQWSTVLTHNFTKTDFSIMHLKVHFSACLQECWSTYLYALGMTNILYALCRTLNLSTQHRTLPPILYNVAHCNLLQSHYIQNYKWPTDMHSVNFSPKKKKKKNSGKIKPSHQPALTISCTTFWFNECRGTA